MFERPFQSVSKVINWFFELPAIRQLSEKYPRSFTFLRERFNTRQFFGLPFTIILLVLWANFAMLSEISENLVNSPGMKAIDGFVSNSLFNLRTPFLTKIMVNFTALGNVLPMTIITIIAGLFLAIKRNWNFLLTLLISVLGNGTSVYLVKNYFHRERPLNIAYFSLTTYSFPSGHAAGAVALQGLLFYFLILQTKKIHYQYRFLLAGISYILLIGFSRIYLGVHFLSDVIGGYSLGFIWLLLAIVFLEYSMHKTQATKAKR